MGRKKGEKCTLNGSSNERQTQYARNVGKGRERGQRGKRKEGQRGRVCTVKRKGAARSGRGTWAKNKRRKRKKDGLIVLLKGQKKRGESKTNIIKVTGREKKNSTSNSRRDTTDAAAPICEKTWSRKVGKVGKSCHQNLL